MAAIAEPPAKPAAPVVTPPPEPKPPPPPAPGEPNPFAEIDAAMERVPESDRFPKPDTTPAQPKPPEPKPHVPPPKPEPKAAVTPKESFAELRESREKLKAEKAEVEKSVSDLQSKIKDYEAKGKDVTVLEQRLAGMEKELGDLRAKNRVLKFETSDSYKAENAKFDKLAQRAEGVINQIEFETVNEQTQEVTKHKPGFSEFRRIYGLNEFLARKEAKRVFGEDGAAVAMEYYMRLHGMDESMTEMRNKEEAEWKENTEKENAKAVVERDQIASARQAVRKDMVEKEPLYRDAPDDKESAALRNKAYAIFDSEPASPAHRIVKEEAVRHIVAAHGPLKLKVAKLEAELKALKEGKAGESEVPGKTKRGGGGEAPPADEDWNDAARRELTEGGGA